MASTGLRRGRKTRRVDGNLGNLGDLADVGNVDTDGPRGRRGRRHAAAVLVVVALFTGCAEKTVVVPAAPAVSSRQLILGTGALCDTDKACGVGPWTGACVLGTCFGLLTTETQAVRATLLERIARAPAPVQAVVVARLLKALRHPMSSVTTRVGALDGLGVTLHVGQPCGDACEALLAARLESEATVAVAARLGLSRRADVRVLDALIDDTREGTEHLRCSAARALGRFRASAAAPADRALGVLRPLLDDRAPNVRRAAAESLARWRGRADVTRALNAAAVRHPGDLRYIVARARLAPGEKP